MQEIKSSKLQLYQNIIFVMKKKNDITVVASPITQLAFKTCYHLLNLSVFQKPIEQ